MRRLAAAALTACALAGTLAACGGSAPATRRVAQTQRLSAQAEQEAALEAATVRAADCAFWDHASTAQRTHLLGEMRRFFGAPVDSETAPGAYGTALPDARAVEVLDAGCSPSYAGSFKLYKLYGRAAAFTEPASDSASDR